MCFRMQPKGDRFLSKWQSNFPLMVSSSDLKVLNRIATTRFSGASLLFQGIIILVLIIPILTACQTISPPKQPDGTKVSDPLFPTPPVEEPILTYMLPSFGSEKLPSSSLIWLSADKIGVSTQNDVLIAKFPTSGPAVQELTNLQSAGTTQNPTFLSTSLDRGILAWISEGRKVNFWDYSHSSEPNEFEVQEYPITGIGLNPKSNELAFATIQGKVTLVDTSQNMLSTAWQAPAWLSNISFSPDGTSIAGADLANFTFYIYSRDGTLQNQFVWDQSADPVLYGAFINPNWSAIAWVARNTLQFNMLSDGQMKTQHNHQDAISAVAWSPNSELFATGSAMIESAHSTPVVYIWDIQKNQLMKTIQIERPVQSISFSPDNFNIAILDVNGIIKIFPTDH